MSPRPPRTPATPQQLLAFEVATAAEAFEEAITSPSPADLSVQEAGFRVIARWAGPGFDDVTTAAVTRAITGRVEAYLRRVQEAEAFFTARRDDAAGTTDRPEGRDIR